MLETIPLCDFSIWLRKQGGVVTVGKYRGYTGKEVYEMDEGYAKWVKGLKRPGAGLIAIKNYVSEIEEKEEKEE